MNNNPLPKIGSGEFEFWENFLPHPETHIWR